MRAYSSRKLLKSVSLDSGCAMTKILMQDRSLAFYDYLSTEKTLIGSGGDNDHLSAAMLSLRAQQDSPHFLLRVVGLG